ncbi:type IV pilus modification PilV family protein [Zobellella iuensis]|uniref:Prepilin-type N-terminal cleavage/methylation domain-containing protein n=1 Tax=Zobellella iuensis TaxID=2803811 RepID=A0ABS1QQV4_9GAMM|nr:prepilin-type N-terminal cleavage/methylation domain-containing protein [Zobellella iuensis]MBL1376846.1 prepilin-type N-terminal cleavage/methylation domain-containing protein [Zobellella iuensis]
MKKQAGFGLVEVVIAFILVAVTAGSLLQLHKVYLEYSRDGRYREVALRLAESKLDELRGFGRIADYQAIASSSAPESVRVDDTDYAIEWGVSDYGWDGGAWVTPLPSGVASGKKAIDITVGWSQPDGGGSLRLESVLSPHLSIGSGPFGTGGDNLGSGKGGPRISHTPGKFPDVVAINLGDDLIQETSKAVITVAKDPASIRVSEKTVIYDSSNNKRQEQEVETVSCTCKLESLGDAELPAQRSLLGQLSYWRRGGGENKKRGAPIDNQQDPFCGLCCKNHFDGSRHEFSHWHDAIKWKNGEKIDGPHAHYDTPSGMAVENVSSPYLESCRLVRIDGFFKVASDWNLVVFNVLPEHFLSEKEEKYQEYVRRVALEYMRAQIKDGDAYDVNGYTLPAEFESFYSFLGIEKSITVQPSSTTRLVARGIYVDIISPGYRQSLLLRMEDGENTSIATLLEKGFIRYLPFEEKELTDKVSWSSDEKDIAGVESGSELKAGTQGETTLRASMLRSNSGLTSNSPISPFERENPVITTLDVHVSEAP